MATKRTLFRTVVILVVVILVAAGSFGAWSYNRPLPTLTAAQTAQASTAAETVSLPWPSQGQASVGAQGYGVFANFGDQKPVPTASVAKLMTALAVLQKKPLSVGQAGPMITVTQHDIDIYNTYFAQDGSLVPVQLGEQISEYDALQALLLPSANNMADLLANWAFGSITDYAQFANNFAKDHDMPKTTISDASGFSPNTVSTAADLIQLGNLSLANPVIAEIVNKSTATIPVAGIIYNVNGLLGRDGINGLKTGNTDQAGGVFLVSAEHTLSDNSKVEVIAAVMGGADLVTAMKSTLPLLSTIKTNFNVKDEIKAGQVFGSYITPWDGKKVGIVASKDAPFVTWSGIPATVKVDLKPVAANQPKGTQVGTATVTAGKKTLSVPLVLKDPTTKPTFWWRLTR